MLAKRLLDELMKKISSHATTCSLLLHLVQHWSSFTVFFIWLSYRISLDSYLFPFCHKSLRDITVRWGIFHYRWDANMKIEKDFLFRCDTGYILLDIEKLKLNRDAEFVTPKWMDSKKTFADFPLGGQMTCDLWNMHDVLWGSGSLMILHISTRHVVHPGHTVQLHRAIVFV